MAREDEETISHLPLSSILQNGTDPRVFYLKLIYLPFQNFCTAYAMSLRQYARVFAYNVVKYIWRNILCIFILKTNTTDLKRREPCCICIFLLCETLAYILRRWLIAHLRFSGFFVSCEVNTRRTVHSPGVISSPCH